MAADNDAKFGVVELLQPAEAVCRAQLVELDGERMTAQVVGGSGRAGRTAGEMLGEHRAQFVAHLGLRWNRCDAPLRP